MFHDLQQIIRGALKVFFAKGQRKTSYSQFGEDMVLGQLIGKDVKIGLILMSVVTIRLSTPILIFYINVGGKVY